jgi:hypothetical protein
VSAIGHPGVEGGERVGEALPVGVVQVDGQPVEVDVVRRAR